MNKITFEHGQVKTERLNVSHPTSPPYNTLTCILFIYASVHTSFSSSYLGSRFLLIHAPLKTAGNNFFFFFFNMFYIKYFDYLQSSTRYLFKFIYTMKIIYTCILYNLSNIFVWRIIIMFFAIWTSMLIFVVIITPLSLYFLFLNYKCFSCFFFFLN